MHGRLLTEAEHGQRWAVAARHRLWPIAHVDYEVHVRQVVDDLEEEVLDALAARREEAVLVAVWERQLEIWNVLE